MTGTLFVVATPIGNLEDMSPRARQTLADVDLIAAEDTRRTGRLLSHFGLKRPQMALHDHNEEEESAEVIARLEKGESVALVSDAGTPLVSDPGYQLLVAARRRGIRVCPIPGPSALTAAISVSGLPSDRFTFEGFLPPRRAQRRAALEALRHERRTMVFYESVHRVRETLDDLREIFGADREAWLGRELTKLNEQTLGGTLASLAAAVADGSVPTRGEFVLVVAGSAADPPGDVDETRLLDALLDVVPGKQAVDIVVAATGGNRNALYQRMLEIRRRREPG